MGVQSDLVVGDDRDGETIANTANPSEAFGGMDIKGIDSVKFNTLHSIVIGS